MVDLASPEARERIARAIADAIVTTRPPGESLVVVRGPVTDEEWADVGAKGERELMEKLADAALAEVAAMLKEGG